MELQLDASHFNLFYIIFWLKTTTDTKQWLISSWVFDEHLSAHKQMPEHAVLGAGHISNTGWITCFYFSIDLCIN